MNGTKKNFLAAAAVALTLSLPVAALATGTSDTWLTTKTRVAVLSAVGVAGTSVDVDTVDGLVTLHGKVSNEADRKAAEKAAKRISGVKKVRNLLEVVKEKDEAVVAAKDDEVLAGVKKAIADDGHLKDESGIEVKSVSKGTVVLDGKATTMENHLRAIEDARSVAGVKRVSSTIKSPDSKAVRDAQM